MYVENPTPKTLWLTGRPCSGKTTLAKKLKNDIEDLGVNNIVLLDGDMLRNNLNSDLGFSKEDRKENLRRVSHVCQLFNDNDLFVIASFVSPTEELRNMVSQNIENFLLGYVKCSLEVAEKRDVKGMYKKARRGEIKNFTGIGSPFEEPNRWDILIQTDISNIDRCIEKIDLFDLLC